ncbi:MAG: CinA family nicotinamide mononucleotide deamidase-related protein [Rikenellaceae bacterium]
MKATIITIGDEILMGQTLDTNSQYIAVGLTNIGFEVDMMLSVHDSEEDIRFAVSYGMENSDVVIVTGGLGPTRDDITKKILADYFNTTIEFNPVAMSYLEELLSSRSLPMNENNRSQAYLPESCRLLRNFKGTASGMWFDKGDKTLISLPGVPFEMEHLVDMYVLGELKERYPNLKFEYRMLKVYDVPESALAHILEPWEDKIPDGFSLAYLPTPGMVKLRITARGEAIYTLDELFLSLQKALVGCRISLLDESLESELGALLRAKGKTVSVAESCTGGDIARSITSVSGASEYFMGGVVAYDNSVKHNVLGVNMEDIQAHGAVSERVVCQMAEGVRRVMNTDFGVATSGVAGPTGGSERTPVGTVWIAVSSDKGVRAEKFRFSFTRERNVSKSTAKAMEMLVKVLVSSF